MLQTGLTCQREGTLTLELGWLYIQFRILSIIRPLSNTLMPVGSTKPTKSRLAGDTNGLLVVDVFAPGRARRGPHQGDKRLLRRCHYIVLQDSSSSPRVPLGVDGPWTGGRVAA